MRILQSHHWKLQASAPIPFIQQPLQRVMNDEAVTNVSMQQLFELPLVQQLDHSIQIHLQDMSILLIHDGPRLNKKWEVINKIKLI